MTEIQMENVLNTDKTVVISLEFGKIGLNRKGDIREISTEADKTRLSLVKKLFECDEIDAINKHDAIVRQWLCNRAFQGIISAGFYLLPLTLVDIVQNYLTEAKDKREKLIDAFCLVYADQREKARFSLAAQFKESDYPQDPRGKFRMVWKYLTLGVPDTLPTKLKQAEIAKAEEAWKKASEDVRDALRVSFGELVSHLAERLTPDADGKKKIFRDSCIENMTEFLQLFESRNITRDKDLTSLIEKARQIIANTSPDRIRNSSLTRSKIAADIKEIKSTLDTMITTKSARKFDLE